VGATHVLDGEPVGDGGDDRREVAQRERRADSTVVPGHQHFVQLLVGRDPLVDSFPRRRGELVVEPRTRPQHERDEVVGLLGCPFDVGRRAEPHDLVDRGAAVDGGAD